jgi:hypothetical protein
MLFTVLYMARDVMVLMGENIFRGSNDDFDVFEAFSLSLQPSPAPVQRDAVCNGLPQPVFNV